MSVHVLIVATRYNHAAHITYEWAEKLRDDLLLKSKGAVETCVLLDGEALCHTGKSLEDATECVDYVIFYGHGEDDHWISIPSKAGKLKNVKLVSNSTVSVLNGRKVYAACCKSLTHLGPAFKSAFKSDDFIGYSTDFNFHIPNEGEFSRIVNQSIRDFVLGIKTAKAIVTDQKAEWKALETDFRSGRFKSYPDALLAASCAAANEASIDKA